MLPVRGAGKRAAADSRSSRPSENPSFFFALPPKRKALGMPKPNSKLRIITKKPADAHCLFSLNLRSAWKIFVCQNRFSHCFLRMLLTRHRTLFARGRSHERPRDRSFTRHACGEYRRAALQRRGRTHRRAHRRAHARRLRLPQVQALLCQNGLPARRHYGRHDARPHQNHRRTEKGRSGRFRSHAYAERRDAQLHDLDGTARPH